jgi:hypothetical protein
MTKEGKILDFEEYRKKIQEEDLQDMEILRLPEGLRETGPSPWYLQQQQSNKLPEPPSAG